MDKSSFDMLPQNKKDQFENRVQEFRHKFKNRAERKLFVPKKRYPDSVLYEGLKWLDDIAGPKLPIGELVKVEFYECNKNE